MSNLQQRLIIGSIASAFAILILWLSPYPIFRPIFVFIVTLFISLAASEFYSFAKNKKFQPVIQIGLAGCILYPLSVYAGIEYPSAAILPYTILILTLFGSFLYFFKKGKDPILNISITLFALIYLAIPLTTWLNVAYFFDLSSGQEGRWWLLYLLAVTKITDMGAYFVGSSVGKHKLAPYLSPGKSWEGALGGVLFGIITSVIFHLFSEEIPLKITLFQSILLGLLLSIMGQVGDLAESLLKRDANLKNSSQIPGLGGILDMLDSLVFTSPILYIFLKVQFAYNHLLG